MEFKKSIKIDLTHVHDGLFLCIDGNKQGEINEDILSEFSNEASVKIWEGTTYDYEFTKKGFRLVCNDNQSIVQARKNYENGHLGQIVPNIYVGTLSLSYFHEDDPTNVYHYPLEVQSKKTKYRSDYQFMLNSIAEHCTDLIIQANSPVSHSFESNFEEENETLYQKFAFVNAMIGSEDFELAIGQIVNAPTTKWQNDEQMVHVSRIRKFGRKSLRSLVTGSDRITLPKEHYLQKQGLDSIAQKIPNNRKVDSVDTPENRFVKFALEGFLKFAEDIELHPNAGNRLKSEAKILVDRLNSFLQENLFKDVSRPTTLRLNSPVLQRKSGYRQVLQIWSKFDLAAKLVWNGGQEVYKAGNKNIATLYEYWVFFELLQLVQKVFKIEAKDIDDLIKKDSNGLSLKLAQGKVCCLKGIYIKGNRKLNVKFNYNRPFNYSENRSARGSWSTGMRPDYTISIWPYSLKEVEAEEEEEIVHIHFDAKYKIANINQILDMNGDYDSEKEWSREGIYKNADLLKMHAYKDAIKRTGGAYVLYPGDLPKESNGFHEILPGLGAFPLKPKKGENSILYLEEFLNKVLKHFLDRTSQRDTLASKTYNVVRDMPKKELEVLAPERIDGKKLVLNEVHVLVGYYRGLEHLKWIEDNGVYNVRYGSERYNLTPAMVSAKYLLLYNGENTKFYRLTGNGPQLFLKSELINDLKYPTDPSEEMYMIYKKLMPVEQEFDSIDYSISEIRKTKTDHLPFAVSLEELLRSSEN